MLVTCGLLDAWANALFLVATRHGMLTVVAVLGALYPAATLMLARTVLASASPVPSSAALPWRPPRWRWSPSAEADGRSGPLCSGPGLG